MEILTLLNFKLKHRAGNASIVPDALSWRERDVPENDMDMRVKNRERILLQEKLWVNQVSTSDLKCLFAEKKKIFINCGKKRYHRKRRHRIT